jgi:hypothetical protein
MNGDTEPFQNVWPRLAARFECKIPTPMFPGGGVTDSKGFKSFVPTTVRMSNKHPLTVRAVEIGVSPHPEKKKRHQPCSCRLPREMGQVQCLQLGMGKVAGHLQT